MTTEEPDLAFDIDALFAHMMGDLGHETTDPQDWIFSLRSAELGHLEIVAAQLEGEFEVQIQETVEEIDVDGSSSMGDPMLSVIKQDALTADQVKEIAARIELIANERGLVYEGVSSYDPIDEEELLGWLPPEDAGWRLRHMTDCGLAEGTELPWVFLVLAESLDGIKKISDELDQAGFTEREEYDEPDENGEVGMSVFVIGRNDEAELMTASDNIHAISEKHEGHLEGIQFYTREEMNEVFGDDKERSLE